MVWLPWDTLYATVFSGEMWSVNVYPQLTGQRAALSDQIKLYTSGTVTPEPRY